MAVLGKRAGGHAVGMGWWGADAEAQKSGARPAGGKPCQLSKVVSLTVISRASVMGYASADAPPSRQIASELRVGSVVEGSVQVSDGRLRVHVQLIDAATHTHIWAERFDRTLEDAFALQSDVAQQIVAAVGAALSTTARQGLTEAPTANADAYLLYLQGREYVTRVGQAQHNYEIAQPLFERALALDPGFALASPACARIRAQAGEAAAAVAEIERLLARSSSLSVHQLRLDPRWDPIRNHPRFKALLAKYAVR